MFLYRGCARQCAVTEWVLHGNGLYKMEGPTSGKSRELLVMLAQLVSCSSRGHAAQQIRTAVDCTASC